MTPQVNKSHDTCKCPRCAPQEWLVADLIAAIRERDDVLDVLIWAAKDVLIYRSSDHHQERLREALVAIDEVERTPQ